MNNSWFLVLITAAGLYLGKLWWSDLRAADAAMPPAGRLPGAVPCSGRAIAIAVAGTLLLVGAETAGEYALGIAALQTRMTWTFAVYSICAAPLIEEIIFRGYIVVEHRGRFAMWTSAVAASAVFALLHPFLWAWESGGPAITANSKAWFSTAFAFLASLWFYGARLGPWNRSRSLLPCFAAHMAKNAAVVAIKATTGLVGAV